MTFCFNRKCDKIRPYEALFEDYSIATYKKSNKIWANFSHFLDYTNAIIQWMILFGYNTLEKVKMNSSNLELGMILILH